VIVSVIRAANILFCGLLLAWVAGCASGHKDMAVSAPPTTEELPKITEIQRSIPAYVIRENPEHESRVRLVPEFVEPELTAEERAALGERSSDFKFLRYPDRREPPGSTVGSFYGGVATYSHGWGFPATGVYGRSAISGMAGWGGAGVGVDSFGSRVSAAGEFHRSPVMRGPRGDINVQTDTTDSKVAGRKPTIER